MSDREHIDFSAEAAERDLSAVVDALGIESFAIYNHILAGEGALAYVANNPRCITALVYWIGQTLAISDESLRQFEAVQALADEEWGLYTNITSRLLFGWDSGFATPYATMLRAGSSPEARTKGIEASQLRGMHLLDRIQVPVLIAHVTGAEAPTRRARKVASVIPSASVLSVPGDSSLLAPVAYGNDQLSAAIADFVEAQAARVAGASDRTAAAPHGTAVILFADIAGSTALTERLGDAAFRAKARELDGALRRVIGDHAGTCIDAKTLGDGVLATFSSASQAIGAALACGKAGEDAGLPLHLGLHAGDVIREEGNVFGGAVNVAARVSALSAPGEVLVSDTVRGLARTSAGVGFEDRGEREMKGVAEPVRVWAVRQAS
jgi:class 3 adenylate cyclase